MRPGNGLGHGGQGRIDLPGAGETVLQDLDLQGLSLVGTRQDGAGRWNALVGAQPQVGCFRVRDRRGVLGRSRRRQAQIGIPGQFFGALTCALGQIAFRPGLQPPGNALDQPGFVAGPRLFAPSNLDQSQRR